MKAGRSGRREFLRDTLGLALLGMGTATFAAPEFGMAKFVTAGPPGSVMDIICRRLSEVLAGDYAKSVVVDNRPGAAVQIASTLVKNAPADGGTFLLTPLPSMYLYPHTYKRLPYDPKTDFLGVCTVAELDLALAVGPEVPSEITELRAYFEWCKKDPKRASFGSPAVGATTHFVGVMAGREAGVDMQHIGYKGPTPAVLAMLSGQIPAACATLTDFVPFTKAGKCRLLATSGPTRSRFSPNTPTFLEQGFAGIESRDKFGVYMPINTPPQKAEQLSRLIRPAVARDDVRRTLEDNALEPTWGSAAQLQAFVSSEHERWGGIVKKVGFSAES